MLLAFAGWDKSKRPDLGQGSATANEDLFENKSSGKPGTKELQNKGVTDNKSARGKYWTLDDRRLKLWLVNRPDSLEVKNRVRRE